MYNKIALIISLVCLNIVTNSHASTIKTHAIIDANELSNQGRSCWYDNKRYSEGALIQIHSFILLCALKTPDHNNSQLIWLKIDKQGNAIYPKKPKTITVN